jgi:hypothetical protein
MEKVIITFIIAIKVIQFALLLYCDWLFVERIFQHDNGIGKDIKTLTITFVIR